jgi:signal transduction histidine kinase
MSRATRIMIVLLFAAGQGVRTTITSCCKRQSNWGNAGEIRQLGGTLEIHSDGRGTLIVARLPIDSSVATSFA